MDVRNLADLRRYVEGRLGTPNLAGELAEARVEAAAAARTLEAKSTGNSLCALGECLKIVRGSPDDESVALGLRQAPWRWAETRGAVGFTLVHADTGEALAWFPRFNSPLVAAPSGRRWAGATGSELVLLALGGGHDLERRVREAPVPVHSA
ncbi:MAG: hypothetical protein HYZ53_18465 [Planctomycetes bacterium]|nr:hypothetical protein [Planctomycetota bacterium]